ncbi:MAG: type II toxin-antitoxin system mRNA interferase toxin, RelE/StbE family [Patescibacteria group bacterium]
MPKILYSKKFKKKLNKYSGKQKDRIKSKIWVFVEEPYHQSLKTHKLTGELKDYWAFSIEYNLRIMFRFSRKDKVEFIDIGTHEIYK